MGSLGVSRSATLLMKLLLSANDGNVLEMIWRSALIRARRIWCGVADPLIEYDYHGAKLLMPLSHCLPLTLRSHPQCSENLGRIVANLVTKYPNLAVIDIGANIGDSVAIIHRHAKVPILCIEGEPKFVDLLKTNIVTVSPSPVVEQTYVGSDDESLVPLVQGGTARLAVIETGNATSVRMKSLDQILSGHPEFQDSHLLKVDTDGMDISILNSALGWISQHKPVLFFEYDPDLMRPHGAGALELLSKLSQAGYRRCLIFAGNGDYMFSADVGDQALFAELHEYFSGRTGIDYCDLCVFHREDQDIAEAIRLVELETFRAARHYPPAHLAGS